jgi:hypothetical protein
MIFSPVSKAVPERHSRSLKGLFERRMILDAGFPRAPSKHLPSIKGPGVSASIICTGSRWAREDASFDSTVACMSSSMHSWNADDRSISTTQPWRSRCPKVAS